MPTGSRLLTRRLFPALVSAGLAFLVLTAPGCGRAGVVMVPSPIALLKDARNLDGAKAFDAYVLSQAGQTLLRDVGGVAPVRLHVMQPGDIQSITQLQVIPADPAWIRPHRVDRLSTLSALYGEE